MEETLDDILTELSCKGWQEAVHEIEKTLEEKDKEIERLNNITNNVKQYIKWLIIFNQNINGKFSETIWGKELLDLLEGE